MFIRDKLQLRINVQQNLRKCKKTGENVCRGRADVKRPGWKFCYIRNLPTQGRTEKKETKNLQLLFIARKIYDIIIQITTKETDSEEGNRYR